MSVIRDSVVPLSIGVLIGALPSLLVSIYSDLLPVLLPPLQSVPSDIYVKIILLISLVLIIVVIVAIALYVQAKPKRPLALWGREFGYRWVAEFDYSGVREPLEINVRWLCPTHA